MKIDFNKVVIKLTIADIIRWASYYILLVIWGEHIYNPYLIKYTNADSITLKNLGFMLLWIIVVLFVIPIILYYSEILLKKILNPDKTDL